MPISSISRAHRVRARLAATLLLGCSWTSLSCTDSGQTPGDAAARGTAASASGCEPPVNGLRLWLRASDILLQDGTPLASWPDASGQGIHAVQGATSAQPLVRQAAIAGHAAIEFDGINDRLDLTSNVFATGGHPLTVLAVLQTTDTAGHIAGTGSSDPGFLSTYGRGLSVVAGKPTVKTNSNGSGLNLSGAASVADGQPRLISTVTQTGGSTLFVNGKPAGQSSASLTAYAYGKSTLGASDGSSAGASQDPFAGRMAELMVFDRALSDSERTWLELCLGGRYQLPITLPPGCDGVPGSGAVVDACGVCGGDGGSCADEAVVLEGRALWLRADDLLAADGTPVTRWSDISAQSSHATQGTASAQPLLRRSALAGHATLQFDGVNDRLDLGSNVFASNRFPLTVFVVLRTTDTAGHIVGTGSSSAGFLTTYGGGLFLTAGQAALKANSNGTGLLLPGAAINNGQPRVLSAVAHGGPSTLYINGQLAGESYSPLSAYAYGKSTLGASDGSSSNASQDPFAGELAEVLVYHRVLAESERTLIEQYLGDKYSVPITAPAGCDGVPGSSAVIDACGVCGGNGDSCADEAVVADGRALWLRADDLRAADGSPVGIWHDVSGQGSHATQGSTSLQPVLRRTGIAGHAAIEFDGVNDRLDLGSNVFAAGNFPLTVFAVLQTTDTAGHVVGTGSSDAGFLTTYGSGLTFVAGKPTTKANSNGSGLHLSATASANDGTTRVLTAVAQSGASRLFVDCASLGASTAATNAYAYGRSTLGASDGSLKGQSRDPFAGKLSELIVYRRALLQDERTAIEDYLAAKYGLTGCVHAPPDPAASLAESATMFWRMNEGGTDARADLVSGLNVMPFPADAAGTAPVQAIQGLGQQVNGPAGYHFWRPSAPQMSHGGGSFTWAGWMKLDSFYDSQTFVGKWNNASGGREYRVWYNAALQRFELQASSTGGDGPGEMGVVVHPTPVALDTFYFLEAWHDAGADTLNLRVGTPTTRGAVASSPWTAGVHVSSADLNLGAHNTCEDAHLHGTLDAVGYWKRVLTEAESQRLWNGGAGFEP